MNLKTHTGYPEIQVDEKFNWSAIIIAGDGEVLDSFIGEAKSRPDAIKQATTEIEGVADNYFRPVREVETINSDDVGELKVKGGAS